MKWAKAHFINKVLMALALILLGVVVLVSSFYEHYRFLTVYPYKALFLESNRDVIFKWSEKPINIYVSGHISDKNVRLLKETIDQINSIAGYNSISFTFEKTRGSQIELIFSSVNNTEFEEYYRRFFLEHYGKEGYDEWNSKDGFNIPYSSLHPCFGFSVYNANIFNKSTLKEGIDISRLKPELGIINIGNSERNSERLIKACLREEIAHLAFFILDFKIQESKDSIFNSNIVYNEATDYSEFDEFLIKLLSSEKIKDGMTESDFGTLFKREFILNKLNISNQHNDTIDKI